MLGRLSLVTLAALPLLAGCSTGGGTAAPQAETSTPASSATSTVPSPSESWTPLPRRDDHEVLLGPGGDLDLLPDKVANDLRDLNSVQVERVYAEDGVDQTVVDLVVDNTENRCSGFGTDQGVAFELVTGFDGEAWVRATEGGVGGTWVDSPSTLGEDCADGLPRVVFVGAGSNWPLIDAQRVAVEQVRGQRAVHFHKVEGKDTADTWLVAAGTDIRVVKYVSTVGHKSVSYFDDFDAAGPVLPEPAPDQVVDPGSSSA